MEQLWAIDFLSPGITDAKTILGKWYLSGQVWAKKMAHVSIKMVYKEKLQQNMCDKNEAMKLIFSFF